MRRILSITAVLALMFSAGSPALVSAYSGPEASMACHRPALSGNTPGMAHQHCHDMAGMEGMDDTPAPAVEPPSDEAAFNAADAKCPMGCCSVANSANAASPARALVFTAQLAVELHVSGTDSIFSHNGYSSHTDRGPPLA